MIDPDLEYCITPPNPGEHLEIAEIHHEALINSLVHAGQDEMLVRALCKARVSNTETMWSEIIDDNQGLLYVARQQYQNKIVGFGHMSPGVPGREGLIEALYVDPNCHRRGIGAMLLRTMMDDHLPLRLAAIQDTPAIAFYLSHGFSLTGRPITRPATSEDHGVTFTLVEMSLK